MAYQDADTKYLVEHNIPELVNDLMARLLAVKPPNAAEFLLETLKGIISGRRFFSTAETNYPDFHRHGDAAYMKGKVHLMSKHLSKELYKKLYNVTSDFGFSIDRVIQTGVDNVGPQYVTGLVAGDESCYYKFSELFDPVIKDRHGHDPTRDVQAHDLNPSNLRGGTQADLDPEGIYIKSVRVRTARAISGLPLPPATNRAERRLVEKILVEAYNTLTGDLKGSYHPLNGNKSRPEPFITPAEEEVYRAAGMLFQVPDSPMMLSCVMGRDWPDARGIWHNSDKTFLAWVNEEDHTRLISMQTGGDIAGTFSRFCRGITEAEAAIKRAGYQFMNDPYRGYLACCPSNIGTGVRCGALVSIPNLAYHPRFQELLKKLKLQARGSGGIDSKEEGPLRDISNAERMGFTEVQFVQLAINGIKKIIALEKKLASGGSVDAEIESATYLDDPTLANKCTNLPPHQYTPTPAIRISDARSNYPDFHKHVDPQYMKGKTHLVAKHLSLELYERLSQRVTSSGFTIDRVIQTGVDNVGPQYPTGVIAGDDECFTVFKELYDPIIKDRHGHDPTKDIQPHDLNPNNLKGASQMELDPERKYLKSVRIRTARSVAGLPLPSQCNRAERREVERVLVEAYNSLAGDLKGSYHPLHGNKSRPEPFITHEEEEVYRKAGMLFQEPDSGMMLACRMGRDWPDARGIWHNPDKTFLAWVNEEDHTRLISMELGGDLASVFSRFCRGITEAEAAIVRMGYKFHNDPHRGYLASCPSNIGTGVRCGALVDIPRLCEHPRFQEFLRKLRIQARGAGGIDSKEEGSVRDISNSDRMGFTEVQLVQLAVNGIRKCIALEKKLEAGQKIDADIDNATWQDDPSLKKQT